jgi:hypothetical protein
MTNAAPAADDRRWRAPREDRAVLVDPPFDSAGDLLTANQRRRAEWDYDVQGRSLTELAGAARRELIEAARRYTAAYRDVPASTPLDRIVLAGHQPQLFHPGVWLKMFALAGLGRARQATAVNLMIDSDTVKSAGVAVPGGTVEQPTARRIAYDADATEAPFEERRIVDFELLSSFGRRAAEEIARLVPEPIVRDLWPRVVERARETNNLGAALAQGRHRLEGEWGLATLELPQGRVCDLHAFRWFAVHLMAEAPRLRQAYNRAVGDYRRSHRLRSVKHPVPDLTVEGDWTEAPFWIWQIGDPRRRRLFVHRSGDDLVLTDRGPLTIRLPLPAGASAARAVDALAAAAAQGVRLRTRALATTLWARLGLSDLFVHGIGGAKYDRATDDLAREFFGFSSPQYLVVTGTLRLPIDRPPATIEDLRKIERQIRELEFQPDRHLDLDEASPETAINVKKIVAERRKWIETVPARGDGRERCQAIRAANTALQPWVASRRRTLVADRAALVERLRAEAILGSREHPFCLYPEKTLRGFLLAFSRDGT